MLVTSCKHCDSFLPSTSGILFCPQCGATINDIENESIKKRKSNKVSMMSQILLSSLPFLAFVAAKRVNKLRIFIVLFASLTFVLVVGQIILIIASNSFESLHLDLSYLNNRFGVLIIFLGSPCVASWMMIYWIRKWTNEWNDLVNFLSSMEKLSHN